MPMQELLNSLVQGLAFDPALLLQPDMLLRLALELCLLVASAFFSSSETALFSLSRLDLQQLRQQRHPRFYVLQGLLEQPRRLIISILCGNELINVAATANMTAILVQLYGEAEAGLLNVLIMVPLLLLVGEVTPKTIAVSDPIAVSTRISAAPMTVWVRLIAPFRWAIRLVSDRLTTWLVGEEPTVNNILQVDEFRTLVDDVAKGGELSSRERAYIFNLLDAGTTEVVEIMTPRTQAAFVNASQRVPEVAARVRSLRHNRLPVYRGQRDHVIGFIHAEDILQLTLQDADLEGMELETLVHPPIMVPLTKKVDEMFDFFVDNNAQAAVVLNEFGGIEGIITINDVLHFIFGQIHGDDRPRYCAMPEQDVYAIPGEMKLTEFNDLTNFGIEDRRMTTVAGIILRQLDRLPQVDDEVVIEGITFRVLKMDQHRIAQVLACRGPGSQYESFIAQLQAEADAGTEGRP